MKNYSAHNSHPARSGSTLAEVLIAVMVLGIGVISVATLFPIAVLQAVRANHITQATILRYNAEAAVDSLDLSNRVIFFGPDGRPGTVGGIAGWDVGPDGAPGRAGVDDAPTDGNIDDGAEFGRPVSDDYPLWDLTQFRPGQYDINGNLIDLEIVMIDPLGFWLMGGETVPVGSRNGTASPTRARFFGWNDQDNNGIINDNGDAVLDNGEEVTTVLRRITGGHRGNMPGITAGANRTYYGTTPEARSWNYQFPKSFAERLVTLSDQYISELDAPATSAAGNLTQVQLASNVEGNPMNDIVANFLNNNIPVQVVLFDENGNGLVRNVVNTSTNKRIDFTPGLPDSNGDGNPDQQIERAVIQSQNSDFTWLLTATLRSADALPSFDCVVFYKRQFSDADEQLFLMTLGEDFNNNGNIDPGEDLNNNGNLDVLNNVLRFNHAGTDKPQIKKGSYVLDASNGEWYGVANIEEKTTTYTVFTIDRPLRDDNGDGKIFGAFMAGIIDVFPLGRKD